MLSSFQPTSAIAPAKLILSGEHAVVYGRPAIACAINLACHAELEAADRPGLTLRLPGLAPEQQWAGDALRQLPGRLAARYAQFLDGRRPISEVLDRPFDLLAAAFASHAAELAYQDLRLTVRIEPPIGAGLGSSAAAGLAIIAATLRARGLPIDADTLTTHSVALERFQHGTPSGVDSYVCAHGGTIRFARQVSVRRLDSPRAPLHLVFTGTPESSTGQCVAHVARHHRDSARWDDFGTITELVEQALAAAHPGALRDAVRANHRLLVGIDVVPTPVQRFIASLEAEGLAGKICGAGAVDGAGGGMVWVVGGPPPPALCDTFGYHPTQVQADTHGTRSQSGLRAR